MPPLSEGVYTLTEEELARLHGVLLSVDTLVDGIKELTRMCRDYHQHLHGMPLFETDPTYEKMESIQRDSVLLTAAVERLLRAK